MFVTLRLVEEEGSILPHCEASVSPNRSLDESRSAIGSRQRMPVSAQAACEVDNLPTYLPKYTAVIFSLSCPSSALIVSRAT